MAALRTPYGELGGIVTVFGGAEGSRRAELTRKLLELRDELRLCGLAGSFLLDGSYISAKLEPSDFDILYVAPADIEVLKEKSLELRRLLDAQYAEEQGYSLLYAPENSIAIEIITGIWDENSRRCA